MNSEKRYVTRAEFDAACEALWSEIEHQNNLPRRTPAEYKSVPDFLTAIRIYLTRAEVAWDTYPASEQPDGQWQVSEALHSLRKLAAICLRAMIYNGVRSR